AAGHRAGCPSAVSRPHAVPGRSPWRCAMSDTNSPTVRRRRLGMELRRLRESSGLMIEDVAKHLECSMSRVSRIETGKSVAPIRDVRDMLDLYRVTGEDQREQLLTLAKDAQQR